MFHVALVADTSTVATSLDVPIGIQSSPTLRNRKDDPMLLFPCCFVYGFENLVIAHSSFVGKYLSLAAG